MKNIIYLLVGSIVIFSCAVPKSVKYLKQGSVLQKKYKTTIPFEYRNGLIVIKVKIENKNYDFILDTGASNVLSENLKQELDVSILGTEEIGDIYGNTKDLEYGKVGKIKIGGIDFINTVAAITDFNSVTDISCLNVDGIIGSNLMKHAVWGFDFQKQIITIAESESSLNLKESYQEAKFFIGYAGIPSITSKINGKRVLNNTIDFGYTGGVIIPLKEFEKQKDKSITKYTKTFGSGPTGIYGDNENSISYDLKINKIELGGLTMNDRISYAAQNVENGFGLDFFKNYKVVLNWNSKRIKMFEAVPYNFKSLYAFGFGYDFKDNGIYVTSITEKSSASQHLKIGDKIISVDDKNYLKINKEQWCISKENIFDESKEKIKVSILRNEDKITFELVKRILVD